MQLKLPDFHVDAAFEGAKKIAFKQNYQTYNMITKLIHVDIKSWCRHELAANVLIRKRMPRIVKKIMCINPFSSNIYIQILQTEFLTFP